MSPGRQRPHFDRRARPGAPITTLTWEFAHGHEVPEHFHDQDQLVFAQHGVMTVHTRDGAWVVPPQRAVWIPARVPHAIHMSGRVSMRTLYLRPRLVRALPRRCCVVNVAPLLRELIVHACRVPALRRRVRAERHLVDVIADQLESASGVPLQLPHPADPRAVRVAEALAADPGTRRPLRALCRDAGASQRTVERLFRREARMTLGRWRQQLQLMQALRLLAQGHKVAHAALECGYSTPSAFIASFKRALGTTPARYFLPAE